MAAELPVPSDRAWHDLTGPELRTAWGVDVVPLTRAGTDRGRAAVGTIDHCARGNGLVLQFAIVDWRAGEHVSDHLVLPRGTVTLTTSVPSKPFGSRVLIRAARPVPPTMLRRAMLRQKVRGLREIAHRFWVQSLANMVELAKRDATLRPAATVAPTSAQEVLKAAVDSALAPTLL